MVWSGDGAIAFLPLHPATAGHTLVVPRVHVPDFLALDDDLGASMSRAVLAVAHAVRDAMQPDGMNLITSSGTAAQQTVFHLHVHVLPRYDGDRVGDIWPPPEPELTANGTLTAQVPMETVQEKIRSALVPGRGGHGDGRR